MAELLEQTAEGAVGEAEYVIESGISEEASIYKYATHMFFGKLLGMTGLDNLLESFDSTSNFELFYELYIGIGLCFMVAGFSVIVFFICFVVFFPHVLRDNISKITHGLRTSLRGGGP